MLTRGQVAKRLGRSIATVRRLEGTLLHPRRDANGILRFDPAEVDRLAERLRRTRGRGSIGGNARSRWFEGLADADDHDEEDEDDLEEREHRDRLRRQQEEYRAYEEQQRRERDEETRRETERARAEAEEARLSFLRARVVKHASDVAELLRSCSPGELRRLSRDPTFLVALEDLFGSV